MARAHPRATRSAGGERDALAGKIQECYGLTREATARQIPEWQDTQKTTEETK
jgi:uncharacterized protein YjbJ (UPF0337 family)